MKKETHHTNSQDFNKLLSQLDETRHLTYLGGGKSRLEKQKKLGKLTARERINSLLDHPEDFLEIGSLAGHNMYKDHGGCPSGGVVTGIGAISNRLCVIVANDATVKAGAWFPITAKKNLRAQEIALENKLPIIYLVDSAGIYLPLQNEVFADKDHFGRIFRNNAQMSAEGIVQIAAVMGSCVAGGAYLPIMSDESLIVEKTGTIFLAGSYLVKAAIGETIDNEELGGATTHTEISGVTDYKCDSDEDCLEKIRELIATMGPADSSSLFRKTPVEPKKEVQGLLQNFPINRTKPYDIVKIIHHLCDDSKFTEYKKGYGKTLVCGYGHIDGWSIGIVANQRKIVKNADGEMQMGGVIYGDAADKAARFIMNCNQKKIPLLFLHDVSGFMIGGKAEKSGIIKDGAKMVSAMANSVVPKITIILGNSYGAGNYAMCGKAYDPRFIYAWPTAKIGVMSGASASKTLVQIQVGRLNKEGKSLSDEEKKSLTEEISSKYEEELSPYYAAARLWVDEIINPLDTRDIISKSLEIASQSPIKKRYNVGVIQT